MKNEELFKNLEGTLYNYENIEKEIENLQLEIESVKNEYTGCGAITYEERTGPTNKFNSSVENEIIYKEKMINNLNKMIESRKITLKKIDNAINSNVLTDVEKELIYKRYIKGHGRASWWKIAVELNLTEARIYQLRDSSINKLVPIVYVGLAK
ncbi:siderophore-interacting protein [Clostridium sp. YIM B02505]|uniref:Siderophore-interacting protein n=1 Tax=Clostridium yunnanense TaxID=2800325 RepID=A0ABS1EJB7_9CLOT|nr:siderophore-interacting protein [Clostridium yunnanense]MBK1809445.1 siderophore-interacting protein [Clostridium yunnanense]